jgi:acyl-CoA reductase-like NAD-dependent aldehyde dehydrogenase
MSHTIPERKLLINGQETSGDVVVDVRAPFDHRVVARSHQADQRQAGAALAAASAAVPRLRAQSSAQRREVLHGIVAGLKAHGDEIAETIVHEAGKPIALAKNEVARATETFALAAAEVTRFGGEIVPVDGLAAAAGTEAEIRRFAAGVVVGIVPFNFPLNLGAHKVAPALAVGAPIVVKPPPQAPSAQLMLGDIARRAGADPASLQVVACDNTVAEQLATDPRTRVVSFTGSARVGWHLKRVVLGKVVLELGGNAAAVVCDDADVEVAVKRLTTGAWAYAGQVCIKTQRIFLEPHVHDVFVEKFCAAARDIKARDPALAGTLLGPVIDDRAADRIESWVQEAIKGGATALVPFRRSGRMLDPCVLSGVADDARVCREEVFGPVTLIEKVASFDDAIARINASPYGLQSAVFTNDLRKVRRAFHELDVGGVIVNDATTFRSDAMPYGGNKGSGLGREGVRYAMEDFTEARVLVLRP